MQDFLMFKTFITPTLLIFFYYLGALFMPMLAWYLTKWIKNKYFSFLFQEINKAFQTYTTTTHKLSIYISIFLSLVSMELIWRMMFEFFIAYFDMDDTLIKLEGKG